MNSPLLLACLGFYDFADAGIKNSSAIASIRFSNTTYRYDIDREFPGSGRTETPAAFRNALGDDPVDDFAHGAARLVVGMGGRIREMQGT